MRLASVREQRRRPISELVALGVALDGLEGYWQKQRHFGRRVGVFKLPGSRRLPWNRFTAGNVVDIVPAGVTGEWIPPRPEATRWGSPQPMTHHLDALRTAREEALREAQVGGVTIPEGAQLLLVMGSANRDEAVFERGEEFDVQRPNSREHLAFGFGIHYCLGNMLAKLQTRITVEETLRIAPHLRLIEPDEITFGQNLSFRAPKSVPVTWES